MIITFNAEVVQLGNNLEGKPRITLEFEGQAHLVEIEMSKELVSKFWDKMYEKIEVEINFKGIQ